ncbi:MAG: polysaccharide pyruvyl transferase family protein [Gemmatimonadaceae bacterium]
MTRGAPSRNEELVASLARAVEDALDTAIPANRPVALLDFPGYGNVGDSMIWLATVEYLRRRGARIAYSCDLTTYSRETLVRRLPAGTVLLSGGGNLGDLWESHQAMRENAIRQLGAYRIVQLPQSIRFRSAAALERAAGVCDDHPDLTLLVRDRESLAVARAHFRAQSTLAPDVSFLLGVLGSPGTQRRDTVWLLRTDHERAERPLSHPEGGAPPMDWVTDDRTALWRLHGVIRHLLADHPRALRWLRTPLSATYAPLARQRLRRGIALLRGAREVVTDRLHGHILCVLLGIEHYLVDDRYGKLRAFHETWTSSCDLAHWADAAPRPEWSVRCT